jgi:hypothetical protein
VVNVFTAIGCSEKNSSDEITWQGRAECLPHLRYESRRAEIHNSEKSLSELFPTENCPGLASITISLILLFAAMRVEVIDLREASCWFSRNSARYRTTLCKLYQIAVILSAVGIIRKTANVCEVRMQPPFTQLLNEEHETNPLSVEKLLNRPISSGDAMETRKEEYRQCWTKHFRA